MKKLNGLAKYLPWAIVAAGILWNSAILHNDVAHLKADLAEIRADVKALMRQR
jgi:hypothetical protein